MGAIERNSGKPEGYVAEVEKHEDNYRRCLENVLSMFQVKIVC